MTWWEALILGLIQGLTEFLPISSSGHLVLGQYLLGLDDAVAQDVTFEVFVHFGTVLSIATVYRKRLVEIGQATLTILPKPASWATAYRETPPFKMAVLILLSMIPTGVAYVLFRDPIEAFFGDPRLAAGMLLVTGTLLLLTLLRKNPNGKLTPMKTLLIGVAQALALIPGISRSGATICTALYQNVDRETAADFSFLMVLPVIIGATILKTLDLFEVGATLSWVPLLIGTLVAYGAGVWAIHVVLGVVKRGKLQYFAYYCFFIGLLGLWQITG